MLFALSAAHTSSCKKHTQTNTQIQPPTLTYMDIHERICLVERFSTKQVCVHRNSRRLHATPTPHTHTAITSDTYGRRVIRVLDLALLF